MNLPDSMATTDISDRDATQTFVALRYWARASQYEPTDAEKQVLSSCEARSNRFWQAGLAVGGGGGLALASVAKVNLPQRAAIAGAFGSAASFFGQYKANKPCLQDLFEASRTAQSPLVAQARQIQRDGSTATVQRLHLEQQQRIQQEQQHDERAGQAARAVSAPSGPQAFATPDSTPAASLAEDTDVAPLDDLGPNSSPLHSASPATNSWEAIRQRHQARLAVDPPPLGTGRPVARPPVLETAPLDAAPRRAPRRNAYGDEVVDQ
jgi:hypothetical protein